MTNSSEHRISASQQLTPRYGLTVLKRALEKCCHRIAKFHKLYIGLSWTKAIDTRHVVVGDSENIFMCSICVEVTSSKTDEINNKTRALKNRWLSNAAMAIVAEDKLSQYRKTGSPIDSLFNNSYRFYCIDDMSLPAQEALLKLLVFHNNDFTIIKNRFAPMQNSPIICNCTSIESIVNQVGLEESLEQLFVESDLYN